MMRLPCVTSVSTWQTSRAVRGEVVFKLFASEELLAHS